MSRGLPKGPWDRQDTGTTANGGSHWDVPGTPNGTVGQTGHWDNYQAWESLGCPKDSQKDCGTDRTPGQLPRVGVLGMSQGLPKGLWDRQDTGTTAKGGSPWDVPGTPKGTVVGRTGDWDNSQRWESLGCPGNSPRVGVLGMFWGLLVVWNCGTDRTLCQLPKCGSTSLGPSNR